MPPPLLSPLCPPSLRHRVPTGDSWGIFTFLCAALCNLPALPALNCTEELGAGQSIQKTYDLTRYLEHQLRTLAGTYVSRSSPAPYPLPAPPPCTGMEIGGGGLPCLSSPCPSLLGDAPVGPGSPERVHPTKVLCPPVPWHRVPAVHPTSVGVPPPRGTVAQGRRGPGMAWSGGGNGGQWASPQGGEGNGHPTATRRDPPPPPAPG